MFRFRHSSVVSAFGVLAVALVASAGTLSVPGEPPVTFLAIGPAGFKIDGKIPGLKATDDGTTLKLSLPLTRVSTGMGLRDTHCKDEVFEVNHKEEKEEEKKKWGEFPNKVATLTVQKSALKIPEGGKPSTGKVSGLLTVHKSQQTVSITYTATPVAGGYKVDGSFPMDITRWGMKPPKKFGIEVKKDVTVKASFKVEEK
jgi:hypothetical protein